MLLRLHTSYKKLSIKDFSHFENCLKDFQRDPTAKCKDASIIPELSCLNDYDSSPVDENNNSLDYHSGLNKNGLVYGKKIEHAARQLVISFGNDTELKMIKKIFLSTEKNKQEGRSFGIEGKQLIKAHLSKIFHFLNVYGTFLHLDETSPHLHIIGVVLNKTLSLSNKESKNNLTASQAFNKQNLKKQGMMLRELHKETAIKMTELLLRNNICYEKVRKVIEQTENPRTLKYEGIQVESIQENKPFDEGIKNKVIANIAVDLKNGDLLKKDLLNFGLLLTELLNKDLKLSTPIEKYKFESTKINAFLNNLQDKEITKEDIKEALTLSELSIRNGFEINKFGLISEQIVQFLLDNEKNHK